MQNPQTNLRPRGNLRESYLSPRAGSEFDFETPRTRTTRMGTRGRGDRLSPIQDEEDEEIERPSIATRSRQGYATSRFPSYADVFAQPAEGQRPGAPRINSRSQFPHYVEEDGQPFATRIDSRSRIQTPLHNVPQSARSRQPTPFPQIPTRRTLNVRFPVQTKITTITRTISRTQLTHPQARPLGTPDSPSFEQASNPFFNRPTSRAPQNIPNIARPGGVRNPFSDSDDEDSDSVDQDEDEVPITPRVHHRPGSPSSRPAPRTPNLSRPLDSPPETPESRPESPPSPDQERPVPLSTKTSNSFNSSQASKP
ncbi:hypothetical protein HYFRA_00006385 [Hymenoscyphus fraxineus]|uniref:Uncharacterized protein n=1 Tax=Hymenoscyphus fraxineus TaxID=746836 RepID=A0A9N9KQ16_9HELO|nr:hypothetical protein HYFRA_00006385 [Hymenoscyphus fraxineus]